MIIIEGFIIFSFGGVLGYFVRLFLEDRMTRSRNLEVIHITEFNKAVTKFKEAFLPIRMALNPAQFALKEDLAVFLESHFQDLRRAVLEFSDILDTKTKTDFLETWYEYYCHPKTQNDKTIPYFGQYSCRGLTTKQEHEKKEFVQSRIEKILRFAKPK